MRHHYLTLNDVQTHVITLGDPFDCNGKDVIICIAGNPGLPDFYGAFASEIYSTTGLPICIIGQAGHEKVPDNKSNILKGQENLFNLEGQIKHKLDLINNYIDKQSKLHLIGHSIGAWLIVELLDENENLAMRVSSINLLFPTLQKMAKTLNGKILNNIIRTIHVLIMFLFYLAAFLPVFITSFFIDVYLKVHSTPLYHSTSVNKFLHPKVGEKVLFLAYNEMDIVKQLNIKTLENIKEKTNVIYSNHDNWAPLHFIEDLHKFQPEMTLTEVDANHAFVLRSSEKVAEMVTKYIKMKM